ncbi:MAG: hypothetical protein IJV98_01910 [Clostridia bacterium]|nr:hypothetical protein [Clostridia bacterium]
MKSEKLQNAIGAVDETLVLRADEQPKKQRHRAFRWTASVAAMLVAAIAVGILFGRGGPINMNVYAIREASYPEMASYPGGEYLPGFDGRYDAWRDDRMAIRPYYGRSAELATFVQRTVSEFLSDAEGENLVYSPLNVYMALAMLSELTEGESREQILSLIGVSDIETLREQAYAVWRANYCDDGAVTSVLASSLWLNENVSYNEDTMRLLTENYFASSYRGEMGSRDFDRALQTWLNEQTGGLLEDQIGDITLTPETIMALATTVYFRAKWADRFAEQDTEQAIFHGANGDVRTDFMHETNLWGTYYWGERFSATRKSLEGSGDMWFILPDEGVDACELLSDTEALSFITAGAKWQNHKGMRVNLSVPKFDVSSELKLGDKLQALGVTDCFRWGEADFSPMLTEAQDVVLSDVRHGARVAIDEEGVTAAAYTVMLMAGSAMPPEDEIDFILDRPFLFVLTGEDGSVLFVGVVNRV